MGVSNENKKYSKLWIASGLVFGSAVGAILGVIAYNNQWLG